MYGSRSLFLQAFAIRSCSSIGTTKFFSKSSFRHIRPSFSMQIFCRYFVEIDHFKGAVTHVFRVAFIIGRFLHRAQMSSQDTGQIFDYFFCHLFSSAIIQLISKRIQHLYGRSHSLIDGIDMVRHTFYFHIIMVHGRQIIIHFLTKPMFHRKQI